MSKRPPIKCQCTARSTFAFCKVCSVVKMTLLLKNGCDDLKITTPGGKKVNPVWYNFYSKNRKPVEYIIAGMLRRVQDDVIINFTQVIQFYENKPAGKLLATTRV